MSSKEEQRYYLYPLIEREEMVVQHTDPPRIIVSLSHGEREHLLDWRTAKRWLSSCLRGRRRRRFVFLGSKPYPYKCL